MPDTPTAVWLEVFGRAHPMVLHLPFGLLAALVALELWARCRRRPLETSTRGLLAGLLALSALVAAASGWFLGESPDYGGERLELHRKLGIATAVLSALAALAAWRELRKLYAVALSAALVLLVLAGHHGGSMTHGEGFLFEPLNRTPRDAGAEGSRSELVSDAAGTTASPVADPADDTRAFEERARLAPHAQELLIARCGKCHGADRTKAGLALHERDAILAGARSGPVVVPGDVAASELVRRLRLPLEDDDHMPPEGKPQLSPEEQDAIVAWVAAGLPASSMALSNAATPAAPLRVTLSDAQTAAVARLRDTQIHVGSADPGSGLLWVDFRAQPATDDAEVLALVEQLGPAIGELSLHGTAVSDAALSSLGRLPALTRLDLARTSVGGARLGELRGLERLSALDLTSTAVDDDAVDSLLALPALEQLFVWDTGLSAQGVARLRAARPGLRVVDGRDLFADALEFEPEPQLSEPRVAVNSACPVTGSEVDPLISVEHEGLVVGFCCENCPASFLADPAAYPVRRVGPRLGVGAHGYEWVPDWLQLPAGQAELGNTHGEIVIDRAGRLHLNTDTEQAIMVFAPDGRFLRSWGAEFADGLHGMQLVEEDDEEYLYFVHFNRHEFVKATLAGEIVWRMGHPEESGVYESAEQFRPTSIAVAPDGGFFVADGYGQHWVHQYDAERRWIRALGGPGSEPGRFQTPHGVWIDTRGEQPELLVADRENHRLQRFDLEGEHLGVIEGMLRRPCKIQQRGEFLVIPDLAGRVTILDGNDELVTQLGDNPDPSRRANNGVPREDWRDGEFLAPHSAAWDAEGNLYVMDWNRHGRITKLRRITP